MQHKARRLNNERARERARVADMKDQVNKRAKPVRMYMPQEGA